MSKFRVSSDALSGSRRWMVVALCSFMVASGLWANTGQGEAWSRLDTAHFTLFSNLDEASTREIGADLERLRAALEEIFQQASFDSPLPTFLYVFSDPASFAPFALDTGGPGFLVPHQQANFAAVLGVDVATAVPIVYRQYLLELINDNTPELPLWFRIGLAELFSTFSADSEQAVVGRVGEDDLGVKISDSIPPSAFVNGQATVGPSDTKLAQVLVHYLLVEEAERRATTLAWVRELEEGGDHGTTLLEALGLSDGEFDAAVQAYDGADTLPTITMPLTGVNVDGELVPMAKHEALFRLGDLLIHSSPDRLAEATRLFEQAYELAPDDATSQAGMGLAKERAGDLVAADAFFEKAAAQNASAFRLHFLYGDVKLQRLGKRRPTNAEEEALLEKAIAGFALTTELNPDFGEGWARLGYAYNLQAKPSADALPALERAYDMLPDRSDVAYNLLLGYARSGKRNEAAELVSLLESRGADEATLGRSQEIVYQLDFQAAGQLARQGKMAEARELFTGIAEGSGDEALKARAKEALAALGGG